MMKTEATPLLHQNRDVEKRAIAAKVTHELTKNAKVLSL